MASDELVRTLFDKVENWIIQEHESQVSNTTYVKTDPKGHAYDILKYQLPGNWKQYQDLRHQMVYDLDPEYGEAEVIDEDLQAKIGQAILKTAGGAHDVFIWSALARGLSLDEAASKSWVALNRFKTNVRIKEWNLPGADLLRKSEISDAVNTYSREFYAYSNNPSKLFVVSAGLAVAALAEVVDYNGQAVIPSPGSEINSIEGWEIARGPKMQITEELTAVEPTTQSQ